MPHRGFMIAAALFGFLAVAAQAFGAHLLDAHGNDRAVRLVRTAADQQMWHALAMLAAGTFSAAGRWPLALFAGGIVLFSGSLYALAFGAPTSIGMITPLGGSLLLLGWLALAGSFARSRFQQ